MAACPTAIDIILRHRLKVISFISIFFNDVIPQQGILLNDIRKHASITPVHITHVPIKSTIPTCIT
jgi:hypothetical protein